MAADLNSPPCTPEPSFPPSSSSPHQSPHHGRTPLGSPQRHYPGPHINAAGVNICKHNLIDGGSPIHPRIISSFNIFILGTPVDADGYELEPSVDPNLPSLHDNSANYFPFESRADFEFTKWMYSKSQVSANRIDELLHILAKLYQDQLPPAFKHDQVYEKIDNIKPGGTPWDSFTVYYNGPEIIAADGKPPVWATAGYEVWFRDPEELFADMIGNPEFNGQINYGPKIVTKDGKRRYKNVMAGKWAWNQAVWSLLVFISISC